jgi:glycosyltransferase involved in cell wall biosynthesis
MVRVSVIIPSYNREQLLAETLQSVRRQTFARWEVIVVDDHSNDATLAVARDFAARDPRFVAVRRKDPRKGGNVCRNEGLALARGEYVIFLDSDDLLEAECLSRRVELMDRAPDRAFGVFQTEVFDTQPGDRGMLFNIFNDADDLLRLLSFDAVWHTTGPVWRRQTVEVLGGFDHELPSFQEWDLHLRALATRPKYFKVAVRDHFHRLGPPERDRLGKHSTSRPEHLRSHERLFEKATSLLRAAGLVNEPVRRRLAGIHWWLVSRYRVVISPAEAARLWRKAHQLGLIGRGHLLEGLLFIQIARLKGGRYLGRPLQTFWPPEYVRWFSKTMASTPVSSLDGRMLRVG